MQAYQLQQSNNTQPTMIDITKIITLKEAGIKYAELALRELNEQYGKQLALTQANELPPVEVAIITDMTGNVYYVLIDGYHRLYAAFIRNEKVISAIARTYLNDNHIIETAFKANLKHGLMANKNSRSQYARWLKIVNPQLGVNDIARLTGLDKSVVSRTLAKQNETICYFTNKNYG